MEIQCILQTAHYNHRGHHHLYNLNKKVIKKKTECKLYIRAISEQNGFLLIRITFQSKTFKKAAAKFLFILVCPESAKWKEEENGLMNIETVHPH